ncbi:DUF397 domain-containing protein [Streptomyces sp. 1114.5]|uniref:DUF397 domain-containing protein n=1 Tax=Streptomyces sp. 1114.5 TaxID=1938830 RepID=UPI000EAC396E|nr:DUF397 domain-containing protein [Streptomyces sp. 1114.5]
MRSSYSDYQSGACVEVSSSPSAVHVRDSKDKAGPTLTFSPSAWASFVAFATEAQAAESE